MVVRHITNLPSDKHSGARARTQLLVVHSAETPLSPGYAASVTRNWLNVWHDANGNLIQASINTFFGCDTTVRAVNTNYAAWHASVANGISVGYEFTGYAALSRGQWLTDYGLDMFERAGMEMAEDAGAYGIPLRWLTTDEVNRALAGDTSIKGLCTHRQIDPVNRTDPGDGFPYDHLMECIKKYSGGVVPPTSIYEMDFDMATVEQVVDALFAKEFVKTNGRGNISLGRFLAYSDGNFENILDKVKDINTSDGPISLRQAVATGMRAGQLAAANTAPIIRTGGNVSLRQELANTYNTVAGLEPVILTIVDLVKAPDVDKVALRK